MHIDTNMKACPPPGQATISSSSRPHRKRPSRIAPLQVVVAAATAISSMPRLAAARAGHRHAGRRTNRLIAKTTAATCRRSKRSAT
jgi:hypothetical protein